MGEVAGYNHTKVNEVGNKINSTYGDVVKTVTQKVYDGIVVPMSTKWYAPEAVDEFKKVKTAIEGMEDGMHKAYKAFRDWVQDCGTEWAGQTGGTAPNLPDVGNKHQDLNVGIIKKDKNNDVILDEAGAIAVAGQVSAIHTACLNYLKTKHGELTADTAFIGHGQAAAATACFVRVADSLNSAFSVLDELAPMLEGYAAKYKQVGEQIAAELGKATVNVSVLHTSGN